MRRLCSRLLLVAALAVPASPIYGQPPKATLLTNDSALMQHVKRTDHVFQSLLDDCRRERLTRGNTGRKATFTYQANCDIRPRPEDDCRSYEVEASGTVDGPEWATVRQIKLTLQCSN